MGHILAHLPHPVNPASTAPRPSSRVSACAQLTEERSLWYHVSRVFCLKWGYLTMKADEALVRRLQSAPDREFDLLLRLSADAGDAIGRLSKRGVQVRRRFRLIQALAVRASGKEALRLLEEPWVVAVEEDKEVRAL